MARRRVFHDGVGHGGRRRFAGRRTQRAWPFGHWDSDRGAELPYASALTVSTRLATFTRAPPPPRARTGRNTYTHASHPPAERPRRAVDPQRRSPRGTRSDRRRTTRSSAPTSSAPRSSASACRRTSSARLQQTLARGEALDTSLADAVALAMKEWALEKGATHYTHWFQPLTGLDRREARQLLRARPARARRWPSSPARS